MPACKPLMNLLKLLIDEYESITTALDLEHFVSLFSFFAYNTRKEMAVYAVKNLVDRGTHLKDTNQLGTFLDLIAPLIKDQPDQPTEPVDEDEFSEEQWLVGRFIVLLQADEADMQMLVRRRSGGGWGIDGICWKAASVLSHAPPPFPRRQMLQLARKHFGVGGESRIKHTLPALVFLAMQLTHVYKSKSEEVCCDHRSTRPITPHRPATRPKNSFFFSFSHSLSPLPPFPSLFPSPGPQVGEKGAEDLYVLPPDHQCAGQGRLYRAGPAAVSAGRAGGRPLQV